MCLYHQNISSCYTHIRIIIWLNFNSRLEIVFHRTQKEFLHCLPASSTVFELSIAIYIPYSFTYGLFFFSWKFLVSFFPSVYFQIISKLYDLVRTFLVNELKSRQFLSRWKLMSKKFYYVFIFLLYSFFLKFLILGYQILQIELLS